jgi:hypothetical protein
MVLRIIVVVTALLLASSSCTIKPPEVIITSEKTALENQLLGSTSRITDDPVSTAAVWAASMRYDQPCRDVSDTSLAPDQTARKRLILAQIRRQTMQEYIARLKKSGYTGERHDGFLQVMSDSIADYDVIARVVEAENDDRTIIMEFYGRSQGVKADEEFSAIRENFAGMMARVSPTGTWIEDRQGGWARK